MRKAISEVFGMFAVVQRCQWHKRENVISYLPKYAQELTRRRLQKPIARIHTRRQRR